MNNKKFWNMIDFFSIKLKRKKEIFDEIKKYYFEKKIIKNNQNIFFLIQIKK